MKLKKLFDDLKRCKEYGGKSDYHIIWQVELFRDPWETLFFLLPTVIYQPWIYRQPSGTYVFDICWMCWHIGIGLWKRKEGEMNGYSKLRD